ncbi:MAG: PCRF domain-containing protein [Parcubacteria group bacterium]|nr:PCRF domain-containing protein [Parcubacteria group bacterium]
MKENAILEIRAGTGGEEAAIFAADLLRMYRRFCERKNFRFQFIDASYTNLGGLKNGAAEISGDNIYALLKFESGVHRVQRIPKTEKSGRVHTSTATVAILPEPTEIEIEIKPQDLKIEFFRSSGAGGQNVNKVETAVRLYHLPSGIVVSAQQERSQLKNKELAMKILRSKLFEAKQNKEMEKLIAERRSQIGSALRVEKIRTYNFPQSRITDHRIKKSWHNIDDVLDGNIDPIIKAFKAVSRSSE